MTKKHFSALAHALNESRLPIGPDGYSEGRETNQWRQDVLAIANVCAASNPRFDKARFIAACEGIGSNNRT